MTTGPPDDQSIADYVLGMSSAEESERLDELSVTDDEFAHRIQAIEYDLVDSYAKGALTSERLARFHSHYLASPKRREKLRMAESFLEMADKLAAPDGGAKPSASGRRSGLLNKLFGFFAVPLQWGLTTALLAVMLTAGYLLFENQALRSQAARSRSERAALEERERELERRLAEQRSGDDETERELAQVRERLAQVEQQLVARNRDVGTASEARVIALHLAPQSRGIGQIPTIVVSSGADLVALTLDLEAAGFPAYEAALKNPATGQVIWRTGRIKSSGKSNAIRVSFRAALLNPQNYVLDLSGISSNGDAENVGSYVFRVVKK